MSSNNEKRMQLPLWDQDPQPVEHHLIEVHYVGGGRRILDTVNQEDREAFSDMSITYAGFVRSVVPVEEEE